MSKLSFRARALDASKPMPIYLAEELPDLPDYSAINRAVPQMPSGMEKEEESEHHLQRAISGTGLIIPTPEVCEVSDLEFYERCYPPDYKMPKQHIHMQPLWEEQEAPEYDIDSEDERWLKQQRHPELTEWKFEQMMDKLEKSSGQTVVTLHEAKLLLERHDDLVTAVYDYWLNKRLTTQHALILSVKTESRPGQSSNNPYLAFRRRTEKMQTRKNRKNDESSYEKMLKLRRDLARALTLLELVARRETAKRELVKLTAQLADKRYAAGDFANQLLPDPPPRPQYSAVTISTSSFRAYTVPHYPPRAPPTPVDTPRQREKRPYKRRKYRHPAAAPPGRGEVGAVGAASSSDEELPDDGPFAFRRKPGCYYEMPTSTLCGDPLDPDKAASGAIYSHELDERHRFTLTSVRHPYPRCVGFARRRLCRGGRVALDRLHTPLQDLWERLPHHTEAALHQRRHLQDELEKNVHRTPKEITQDYHTGGKYPWRHAFRQHLSKNPHLWIEPEVKPIKMDMDVKTEPDDEPKYINEDLKSATDLKLNDDYSSLTDAKYISDEVRFSNNDVRRVCGISDSDRARTIECNVKESLRKAMRKRSWSGCSDSSYESDESLQPVEQEFEKFINEVNKKWLHFRPKTPPPSPPPPDFNPEDQAPVTLDTPLAVELRTELPSGGLDTFTTSEFTLADLYGDINPEEKDSSGSAALDGSGDDLLNNFTGLTEDQVESILSETDLKALAEVDLTKGDAKEDLLDVDSFLLQGQGMEGRACPGWRGAGAGRARAGRGRGAGGCSSVRVVASPPDALYVDLVTPDPPSVPNIVPKPAAPKPVAPKSSTPKPVAPKTVVSKPAVPKTATAPTSAPPDLEKQPVPTSKIIVEEVNEVPTHAQIKIEKKRRDDQSVEEVTFAHGVQLKTVQTKHSPLKKHIISSRPVELTALTAVTAGAVSSMAAVTSVAAAVTNVTAQDSPTPQILTVSDSLKVRLQNHLVSSQAGVLVQNGPFPPVAVLPLHHHQTAHAGSGVGSVGGRVGRVGAPLVAVGGGALVQKPLQLHAHAHAHAPLVVTPSGAHLHHVPANKLKVLHAHPLSRAQVVSRSGGGQSVPAVVSLAPLHDSKPLIKQQPLTQLFEIKAAQLGKGPHLVNVVRGSPAGAGAGAGAGAVAGRAEGGEVRRRAVVALEGARHQLPATARPHRLSLSLDARHLLRATLPAPRPQIQLKNRTVQVSAASVAASVAGVAGVAGVSSVGGVGGGAGCSATPKVGTSVVANLLHKTVHLPKSAAPLAANLQAIAFAAPQLKRHPPHPPHAPRPHNDNELVDVGSVSGQGASEPLDAEDESVRRRDSLPMEVT
ncbi:unnamed protein product [Diatraea saccharalis]|uniref:Enhancer of polycomb-like protein n=1 Tax=Diatraea saccharalis TaxID=40085 RepID=A0A9P0C2H4_9NEOP|nr:unnamed protein product [Diatraea saccharalis]